MPKIEVSKIASLLGHKDSVYTLVEGEKPYIFYSAGGDGMVVKWDLNDPGKGQLIAKVDKTIYAICHDSRRVSIGHNYDGIQIIDVIRKEIIGSVHITESAIFDIKEIEDHLVIGDGAGYLIRIATDTMEIVNKIRISTESIRTLAYNPSKEEIAIGCSDNTIKILDCKTFETKHDIKAHNNSVFTLHYALDYQYLLSGSRDAHLKIWNAENEYNIIDDIVAHMYAINSIAFRPDGKYFSTCSMDKSIKIWQTDGFKLLKVIDKGRYAGHGTSVNKLIWTSFNNQLVSASDDRTISIWEINNLP